MFEKLQAYCAEVIKGERRGVFQTLLKGVLLCFSWFYGLGVRLRNLAFDQGWLKRQYPPVPVVISIGNIVAGGTGKTPVTLRIAQEFYEEVPLAVLSRGYRSAAEKQSSPVALSRGSGPMHSAAYCGDEPYLISKRLPKAFVFVGRDRHQAAQQAAQAGAQLILLDDGMQHRHVARDFDVVVIDAGDPFGQGYFLPRGFLREGLDSLARADLVILNHIHGDEHFTSTKERIAKYTQAPVVGTRMAVESIQQFDGAAIESLEGKKVGLFCGIAHPEYFRRTAQEMGAEVVAHYSKPDHTGFNQEELTSFAERCQDAGAELILCTEKDHVRFDAIPETSLPLAWIQMQLDLVQGEQEWKNFIGKAKADLKHRG